MKHRLLLLIALCIGLLAAGCGGATETAEPPPATEPAVVAVAPTDTDVPPTLTAEPTATDAPTETPEPTATAEPTLTPTPEVVVSNCLACHADQEMLVALALPEEEAPGEAESSGVG